MRSRSHAPRAAQCLTERRSSAGTYSPTNPGIHVAGLLADPESYRGADPSLFGRRDRIVIGKHSGAKALTFALAARGIELAPTVTMRLVDLVRRQATRDKRALSLDEVVRLHDEARLTPAASSARRSA